MRTLVPILIPLAALFGCTSSYDQGYDDGCYQGALDGAMWGGADAALCYSADPTPGFVSAGPTRYDLGFADGYDACFPGEYQAAWDFMIVTLEEELGPCE